jgi:beta-lactamase regulating signal transducer with metallopeptidase domain/Leucine-rich repeat (LRR) protein
MMTILLDTWATTMWRACWQGGLVVLVVWSICRLLPSMPARFQCWLWRLAILKFMVVLLVPWFLNVPLLPARSVAIHDLSLQAATPTPTEIPTTTEVPVSPPDHLEVRSSAATDQRSLIELPSVRETVCLAWIIGACWSLLCLLAALYDTVRLQRQGHSTACTSLLEQLAIQGKLFGLRSLPKLLEIDDDGSPMLVGILRPVILMPAATLGRLSISEQKMVLGHELAHIRRADLLWGLVVALVRAVFFFHPLVWLSERQLKLTQEVAADELAIAQQRHDPASYGELLVSVVGKFGPARLVPRVSVETVGSLETLKTRLVAMKIIGCASRRVVVSTTILLAALILVGLVPWRLIAAESNQVTAVADIEHLGGKVIFDEKRPGKPVVGVDLRASKVSDAALEHLNGLPQLKGLDLGDTQITGAGLEYLNGLNQLQGLNLDRTNITDTGLKHLNGFSQLKALDIGGTKVTDAGLEYLRGLSHLESLNLSSTQITGAGLIHLKGLSQLTLLGLFDTKITDAGAEALEGLKQLHMLFLVNTKITDAGLDHLKGLSHLEDLQLQGTKVTAQGVKKLQQALPNCKIQYGSPAIPAGGSSGPGNDKRPPRTDADRHPAVAQLSVGEQRHPPSLVHGDKQTHFKVNLTNGVTVELLGVGENGAGWWQPNGMAWDTNSRLPADWGSPWTAETGQMHRVILLRIKAPLGQDISLFARSQNDKMLAIREPLLTVNGLPGKSAHMDESDLRNELAKEEVIDGKLHGSFPVGATVTNVLIGLPSEWKTIAERDARKADSGGQVGDVVFAPNPTLPQGIFGANPDTTLVTIGYHGNTDQEMRIVAIDQNGHRHLARAIATRPDATPPTATWVFDGAVPRIKTFVVERSSYAWVEFSNVAIQPGQKSGVPQKEAPTETPASRQNPTAHFEPTADEAKAIAEIRKLGGKVTVDEKNPGKPVIDVELESTKVTDAWLEHLKGLNQLHSLILFQTQVTGTGLVHLKSLPRLEILFLTGTPVTDAGLVHLKDFPQLAMLSLTGTQVTDVGLVHLKGVKKLLVLDLTLTKVTNAGLKELGGLTQLRAIALSDTRVTDAGLEHLKGLTELEQLLLAFNVVAGTGVTDAGLEHLRGMAKLNVLNLFGTKVTDAGLGYIKGLNQLQRLDLRRTKVTDAGVKTLQQALPNCKIEH